jgi:hypothetical protein
MSVQMAQAKIKTESVRGKHAALNPTARSAHTCYLAGPGLRVRLLLHASRERKRQ